MSFLGRTEWRCAPLGSGQGRRRRSRMRSTSGRSASVNRFAAARIWNALGMASTATARSPAASSNAPLPKGKLTEDQPRSRMARRDDEHAAQLRLGFVRSALFEERFRREEAAFDRVRRHTAQSAADNRGLGFAPDRLERADELAERVFEARPQLDGPPQARGGLIETGATQVENAEIAMRFRALGIEPRDLLEQPNRVRPPSLLRMLAGGERELLQSSLSRPPIAKLEPRQVRRCPGSTACTSCRCRMGRDHCGRPSL